MRIKAIVILSGLILSSLNYAQGLPTRFPGKQWKQYTTPEQAGFSSEKLKIAQQQFVESDGAGVIVVHNGSVVASWGETTRRFMCASIRKSYLSALYGIYVGNGKIDLHATMADLNIDDIQKLTHSEKQAKVFDLLTARSGIYHPAAFSPRNMESNLPKRGSHLPGTFWYYNNWDFNTLSTIFEQETGKSVFDAFKEHISDPLQMKDFSLRHANYLFEEKSKHPAYLFRMTARDMARFGLLYLNNGNWNGQQIIPEKWVRESTQPFSKELGRFSERESYGYLWWVSGLKGQQMYFASGSGGQRICVLPESNLVVVHVANSYENRNVRHGQFMMLLESILEAKVTEPNEPPRLVAYTPPQREMPRTVKLNKEVLTKYIGVYRHRFLGEFGIERDGDSLILTTRVGKFKLFAVSQNEFIPEDIETPGFFEKADVDAKRNTVVSIVNDNREMERVVFYY